ncbi:MAG: ApaG domain [Verrucomicrobiaceae bacterium]|nr:ApaG domain [Verrucomicrobiaceae bacterium]
MSKKVNVEFELLEGLTVTVDGVQYDVSRPAPPDRPHPFVYHISIHNGSDEVVRIFGRKWIVRDTDGDTMVVEGDGVVGQFPNLAPGQSFSYDSYHVIKSESTATGSFFGSTDDGRPVCVRIPPFEMQPPLFA